MIGHAGALQVDSSKPSCFIGIDPGLDGAIVALIERCPMPVIHDMPTDTHVTGTKNKPTKKRVLNGSKLAMMMRTLQRDAGEIYVLLEEPQMRPAVRPAEPLINGRPHLCTLCKRQHFEVNQGIASQASFKEAGGIIKGVLFGLGIPFETIHPRTWMTDVFHGRSEKLGHRQLAQQLYPICAQQLDRVKDDGRAEALLLADYAKRHRDRPF